MIRATICLGLYLTALAALCFGAAWHIVAAGLLCVVSAPALRR